MFCETNQTRPNFRYNSPNVYMHNIRSHQITVVGTITRLQHLMIIICKLQRFSSLLSSTQTQIDNHHTLEHARVLPKSYNCVSLAFGASLYLDVFNSFEGGG